MRYFLLLVVVGAVCFTAGLFFRRPAQGIVAQKTSEISPNELAAVRAENVKLKADLAARAASNLPAERVSATPRLSGGLEGLKAARDLISSKRAFLNVQLLSHDGSLSDEFADLFSLRENDRLTLKGTIDEARRELERSAIRQAKVTRLAAGNYTIQIPAFIDEGRAVYNRVTDAFKNTLGPEKNLLFSELMGESLEHAFGRFGAEERMLTFTRKVAPDGTRSFYLDDRRVSAEGSSSTQSSALTFEQMKSYPNLTELLRLLPEAAATE